MPRNDTLVSVRLPAAINRRLRDLATRLSNRGPQSVTAQDLIRHEVECLVDRGEPSLRVLPEDVVIYYDSGLVTRLTHTKESRR